MRAPILLLHGVLDGPAAWETVAHHLREAGHKIIVPAAPEDARTPQEVADAARAHLPAHLVGHSRGGTAASWLAVEMPEAARSLAVVASPPQASEVFRAHFAKRVDRARSPRERSTLEYLAAIPDDDFPQHALRRYRGRALVVEYEDDPLYGPTQTLFWRMFLPYADFERVPGGHRAFAENGEAAAWLARRILAHVEAAEAATASG